jgi:hypothetical protein
MSTHKILKEASSKLISYHIENIMTLKPFNNRIVALLNSLDSLANN